MMMWWEVTHLSSLKYPPIALHQSSMAASMTPILISMATSMAISMAIRTSRTARGLRYRHRLVDTSTGMRPLARATQWTRFSSWTDDRGGKLRRTPEEPPRGTPAASAAKPTPRPPT